MSIQADEEGQFSFPTAFVDLTDQLNQRVDPILADNASLDKAGRFGKFVAKNRRKVIWSAVTLLAIGFVTLVGAGLMGSMRLVAAGYNYGFGQTELSHNVTTLRDGTRVYSVLEPRAPISDQYHAMLLLMQIRATDYRPLQESDVKRQYHEWRVTLAEQRSHNFTWNAARELAVATLAAAPDSQRCLCYAQLGLPVNVVMTRPDNDILFEPMIEGDSSYTVNETMIDRGDLYRLVRAARVSMAAAQEPPEMVPADVDFVSVTSGTVRFMRADGWLSRTVIGKKPSEVGVYTCIKHCITFFPSKKSK